MKHNRKQLLLAAVLFIAFSPLAYTQGQWKPRVAQLQSRWAKQVTPEHPFNVYPRPQLERGNWVNLNGLWDYGITDTMAAQPTNYSGRILVPYPIESSLSGVGKSLLPHERLWYRRAFARPVLKDGERLLLHFGAVDWQATVFVNGVEIGQHSGGYTAFSFDITSYLQNGNNELTIKVYDPTDQGPNPHGKQVLKPANIYYSPTSGIWQTVWLEKVPETYINNLVINTNIDKGFVHVLVESGNGSDDFQAEATVFSNGKLVANEKSTSNSIGLDIPNVQLWSPANPHLYTLRVRLFQRGKLMDEVKSYFGMRKVEVKKDSSGFDRIFLNNKYVYNLGVLDQGFWPDGLYTAPTDEALAFDIKAIKAMGFNTIRKHIKIEPARWYYYADKIGLMVWQDFVNPPHQLPEGAKPIFEAETKEIMDQLHNYPSITTWVLFNERWGAYDQKRLTEWVKNYDPSRLVNGHTGELLYVNEKLRAPATDPYVSSDMTDVHSYPDPMNAALQEGKVRVLGEFGGVGVSVPFHQWDDMTGWGYVQVSPQELKTNYAGMIKKLKELEAEGLSGSIYTQPFDVEGEENGLMTYDREIIKIPLADLRELHGQLIDLNSSAFKPDAGIVIGKNLTNELTDENYPAFLAQFKKGKKDAAFLRGLTLMAKRKGDSANANLLTTAYIQSLHNNYDKNSLDFIKAVTKKSSDPGFTLFKDQADKVNAVLGKYASENFVMDMISLEDVGPFSFMTEKRKGADWTAIEKRVVAKYGKPGQERMYLEQLMYYLSVSSNTDSMGNYYKRYLEMALDHPRIHINNISWVVFERVNDPEILQYAVEVMAYDLVHFDQTNVQAYDTYANLLYKTGQQEKALEWEEKARTMAPGDASILQTIEKMKKGEKTWPEK